jgi:hypothetical protein
MFSRGAVAARARALAIAPALGGAAAPTALLGRSATAAGLPVTLAILVPMTVPQTATGLIDSPTLAAYTAPLGLLTRQLDSVYDTPAVIGLDPMIVASIRVLGSTAPASSLAWLARLQGAHNEIFALAYADADLASLARVSSLKLAQPIGFDFAINAGHFGKAVTASPTPTTSASPTPTPSPGSSTTPPPLPTSAAEVLDWAYTLTNIAWPADDTVLSTDLGPLRDAGYQDVVLNSSNVTATVSGAVDLGKVQGIVADAGITSLVRATTSAVGDNAQQSALVRLNSALTGIAAVSPGRTVVATLDRQWPLGSFNLDALFADLAGQAGVTTVGLSTVIVGAHPSAKIVDETNDAARLAQLNSVVDTVGREAAFATAAVTPNLVLEPRRLKLLSLLAVSWLGGSSDWTTQVNSYLGDSLTLTSSVAIVKGSDLFVGAGQTNVPVTVSNALNVPVIVYVNVASTSSVLQVQKQNVALTIEPGSSNKAAIPVQALSNGKVITTVTITSVDRVPLGSPEYVKVDLQPGWESVGTTLIVILLVLVFGGGIVRTFLKRRTTRRKAAVRETVADGVAEGAGAPGD